MIFEVPSNPTIPCNPWAEQREGHENRKKRMEKCSFEGCSWELPVHVTQKSQRDGLHRPGEQSRVVCRTRSCWAGEAFPLDKT